METASGIVEDFRLVLAAVAVGQVVVVYYCVVQVTPNETVHWRWVQSQIVEGGGTVTLMAIEMMVDVVAVASEFGKYWERNFQ